MSSASSAAAVTRSACGHDTVAGHGNHGTELGSWRARRDSNPRPSGPQPDALSTELRAHPMSRHRPRSAGPPLHGRSDARSPAPSPQGGVAEREGFEPSEQVTPLN